MAAFSPSQFVKPRDLHDSTEHSGEDVEQLEQRVSSKEEGDCAGRSRKSSLASSLSSLTTEEEANTSKMSLSESLEDEDDPMAGVGRKKSSLDSAEEEEDSDPMIVTEGKSLVEEESYPKIVAEEKSSGNSSEEEEESNPKIVAEEKSSGNSSEEEEEGDPKIVAEEKLEDALNKSFGEPMAGIELNNPPLDSLDGRGGDAMNVDEDLSVELRRSSRNPKPSYKVMDPPKETKSKGKQTPRKVLLHVSVQIFQCHKI